MSPQPRSPLATLAVVLAAAALAGCGPARTTPAGRSLEDAGSPSIPASTERAPTPAVTLDPTLEAAYSAFEPPLKGSADAAVVVYVFSDYLCPYCRQLALGVLPVIEREMGPDGTAALAFVDFPLTSHGYPAYVSHEAAHCAGEQGRYWDMHDALFAAQPQLAGLDPQDEDGSIRAVLGIAQGIGLDPGGLEPCVTSGRYRPLVAAMAQKALDSGIDTAPSLLLQSDAHTELVTGYVSVDDLRTAVQAALRAATAEAPPRR